MNIKLLRYKNEPPSSASAKGWRDWRIKAKSENPIVYFLREEVTQWFSVRISMRLKDWKWNILHRFHPRHRYNKVDTGLPPGYYDPCTRMIYACFNDLVRFVDHMNEHQVIDWDDCEQSQQEWKEMNVLYTWWKEREHRDEFVDKMWPYVKLPDDWGFLAPFNDDFRDDPRVIEWKVIANIHNAAEAEFYEEDIEMFTRLVKIHHVIWYP